MKMWKVRTDDESISDRESSFEPKHRGIVGATVYAEVP